METHNLNVTDVSDSDNLINYSVSCFACGREYHCRGTRLPKSAWDFAQLGQSINCRWIVDEAKADSVYVCSDICLDASLTPTGRLRKRPKKVPRYDSTTNSDESDSATSGDADSIS